jgi:hypothetical protein
MYREGARPILEGPPSRGEPHHQLRYLDVDDLYLMSFLANGSRLVDAARQLSLTQPAITQRVHKIEQALGLELLDRRFRGTCLSEKGRSVCKYALEAIQQLERLSLLKI